MEFIEYNRIHPHQLVLHTLNYEILISLKKAEMQRHKNKNHEPRNFTSQQRCGHNSAVPVLYYHASTNTLRLLHGKAQPSMML